MPPDLQGMAAPPSAEPRLRADARRNLERILAAAVEVFREQGTDASIDEIARRAGVGHGTVFRRFPCKEELVAATLEHCLAGILAEAEAAAEGEDAWGNLRRVLELMVERQHSDRAFFEATCLASGPAAQAAKERLLALLGELLGRAQARGEVRGDLTPEDLAFLLAAAGSAVPATVGDTDLWRRYLGVILDGMRPGCASPLSPPPPTRDELARAFAVRAVQPR